MLYDIPTPVLVGLLLLSMILVVEGGIRLGLRSGRATWTNAKEILTGLTAASLGLLALMLAFSFNQAASRYDARVHLLSAESNAIVEVGHFLDHLVPEQAEAARDLLARYTEQRITFLAVGHDAAAERAAVEQSRELGDALWAIARESGNYREPERTARANAISQLTEAVSELVTVAREREQARARRVPEAVLGALLGMGALAAGMVAYMAGATGHPDRPKVYTFLMFVCLVAYLIIDFDRPRRGLMRLSPASLEDALDVISHPH